MPGESLEEVLATRDIPYGPDSLRFVWHKSRWRCRESACPRLSFTESLPQVPARCRLTTRLYEQVGAGVADRWHTAVVDAVGPRGCSRTSTGAPPQP